MKRYLNFFCILSVTLLIIGCSTRKDRTINRGYHNMTTWFNTLFNGQQAMETELTNLETGYEDDYFDILRVEPLPSFIPKDDYEEITYKKQEEGTGISINKGREVNLLKNETSNYTGFAKTEEKALKAIEQHSMFIKGKERNKLIARAYLMLGQARYYQGKTFPSIDALNYLLKDQPFKKHNDEGKYYLALANMQAGNNSVAAQYFGELYDKRKDLPKALAADVAKQYAWLYIQEKDYISALNSLNTAIKFARNKDDKARFNYIQGQLLENLKRYDEANEKFSKVYKLKPNFEMEARSQTAIAFNFDPKYNDYNAYKNRLHKLLKIGTYEKYWNEFYYALGTIEFKRDSLDKTEAVLKKSLSEPMSDSRYRAEAYALMADVKFEKADYVYAGAYYDSAVSVIPESNRKTELQKLAEDLKNVMAKYYLVKRNDSILALTQMDDDEKYTYFDNYIEKLKLADAAKIKEEEERSSVFKTENKIPAFNSSFGNEDKGKFYFYSSAAKSNGTTEFKRVWGNVPLQDNWRISTAGTSVADQKAELTGQNNLSNPRRYELEYYLEQIPTSPTEIAQLKMERDTTELSLGIDYFDKFKNVPLATETFEHLIASPPDDEEVKLKAYYNLYRANKNLNKTVADRYKNIILNDYPNTIYAESILNPDANFVTETTQGALNLYDEAFQAFEDKKYGEVQRLTQLAMNNYPLEEIMSKFALLNAMADGAINGKDTYIEALKRVIVLYPDTDESKRAQEILDWLLGKNKPKNNPVAPPDNKDTNKSKDNSPKKFDRAQQIEKIKKNEKDAPKEDATIFNQMIKKNKK